MTGAVGLADVMPTLLDLLGIPAPKLRGRSRRAEAGEIAGEESEARFSEDSRAFLYSVVRGGRHLIWKRDADEYRLFVWRADPRETENLRARDPEAEPELQTLLEREVQRRSRVRLRHAPQLAPEVDAPQRARLRALGYAD